jgi:exopolysaccharide production protein ExoZ
LVVLGQIVRFPGAVSFYSNPLVLEFVAGMAIAKYRIMLPGWTILIGLGAMPILYNALDYRLISFGIPAFLIVAGCLSIEHKAPSIQFLKILGDASYAVYLAHLMALGFVLEIWNQYFVMSYCLLPFAIAVTITVALVLHFAAERPLTSVLGRLRFK